MLINKKVLKYKSTTEVEEKILNYLNNFKSLQLKLRFIVVKIQRRTYFLFTERKAPSDLQKEGALLISSSSREPP